MFVVHVGDVGVVVLDVLVAMRMRVLALRHRIMDVIVMAVVVPVRVLV